MLIETVLTKESLYTKKSLLDGAPIGRATADIFRLSRYFCLIYFEWTLKSENTF